jgi:hypothetical protein
VESVFSSGELRVDGVLWTGAAWSGGGESAELKGL